MCLDTSILAKSMGRRGSIWIQVLVDKDFFLLLLCRTDFCATVFNINVIKIYSVY
jgi:hypothetical protein